MIDSFQTSIRIRKGSALDRLFRATEGASATDRLHVLAERFEAASDVQEALRDIIGQEMMDRITIIRHETNEILEDVPFKEVSDLPGVGTRLPSVGWRKP